MPTNDQKETLTLYDAFLSYSRRVDSSVASRLRDELHSLAKPWYRLRAMRVFRDESSLDMNEAIWESIEGAIRRSRYFVLLASPAAAASPWVRRELATWLESDPTGSKLLIVLTDGEIFWDAATVDFDWEKTDALPAVLSEKLACEPRWEDLRRSEAADAAHFRNAAASISARIHGIPKDQLIGEDVRQHGIAMRVSALVASAVAALVIASGIGFYRADQQHHIALSRRLSDQAELSLRDPLTVERGALLALQAWRSSPLPEASASLRHALQLMPTLVSSFQAQGRVYQVAFHPDGNTVLAGAADRDAIEFDANTGREVRRRVTWSRVWCVAYSPDGRLLATGSEDGGARVFRGPKEIASVASRYERTVTGIAFSGDGRRLVSGSADGRAAVLDTDTGRETGCVPKCNSKSSADTFDNDRYGAPVAPPRVGVQVVAISRDGALAAAGKDDGNVILFRSAGGEQVTGIRLLRRPLALAFSPDGGFLAAGGMDDGVRVIDTRSGKEKARLRSGDYVLSLAFSPDGKYLAVGSVDGSTRVYDGRNFVSIWNGYLGDTIASVAFSADSMLLLAGAVDGSIAAYDSESGRLLAGARHQQSVNSVVFSPEGRRFATGSRDGTARIYDFSDADRVFPLRGDSRGSAIGINDELGLIAEQNWNGNLRVWKRQQVKPVASIAVNTWAIGLALSSDGRYLSMAGEDRLARVFEVQTGRVVFSTLNSDHPRDDEDRDDIVRAPRFVPGSPAALSAGFRSGRWEVHLVGLKSSERRRTFASGLEITDLAITPDQNLMAVALWSPSHEGRPSQAEVVVCAIRPTTEGPVATAGVPAVCVVDGTARLPTVRFDQESYITAVAISADGLLVATGDRKQTVRVSNTSTGSLATSVYTAGPVLHVSFGENGSELRVTARLGSHLLTSVQLLRDENVLTKLCAHVTRDLTPEEEANYLAGEKRVASCQK